MYKATRSFHERCAESRTMLNRYAHRVPVIIEPRDATTPPIDKRKYMAPKDLTASQLFYVVRRRLNMRPDQALFFFIDQKTLVTPSFAVFDLYTKHADDDGFLYLTYSLENAFG